MTRFCVRKCDKTKTYEKESVLRRNVLPGLRLSLGVTLFYVGLIVVLPLAALVFKAASLGPAGFWIGG